METTSVSLLDRIANDGENSDWAKLFSIYRPFVASVVNRYPALVSQSDDITQEVIIILMRELPAFRRQRTGSFRSWLRGITVNQLRIALRKSKKFQQTDSPGIEMEAELDELANPASIAAKKWDEEHDAMVLKRIVKVVRADFKETTWTAFQRYAIEKRPPAEVAAELNISLNSVLLAKSRVLRRMREEAAGLIDE
ncbi:RNA polymerase sigma factor [Aporhodopirellula rubra]|uniref:RNA polymerase sigma factor n=1 Tax=Aporhodopirellula rubra TaxID=980271 RepID=UPI0016099107|nr:sigma-70 family RNA polymerase sigma factor [Aporhodopirellula rubra]